MATDRKETSYFSIGIFILTGIALIIAALIIFGAKTFFQNVIYVETYFDESVQGLSNGSPVKYLGMEVGRVVDIKTVHAVYSLITPEQGQKIGRYIYVKMSISPQLFNIANHNNEETDLQEQIKRDVDQGLRIKLAIQGLTGNAYLELDFVDPKANIPLAIYWTPENYYIPSMPSTLAYFSDSAQYLLGELRKVDFKKMFNTISELAGTTQVTMENASKTMDSTDKLLANTNHQVVEMMTNLQAVSENIRFLTERLRSNPSAVIFSKQPEKLDLNKL